MVDAVENFMSIVMDTITQQVSEWVKRAIEAATSVRPFPHFDYVTTYDGEPSRRPERVPSPHYTGGISVEPARPAPYGAARSTHGSET